MEKTKSIDRLETNKNYEDAHDSYMLGLEIKMHNMDKEKKLHNNRKNLLYTEHFYMRTMRNFFKGSTSFESIRTINGVINPTLKLYAMLWDY